MNDVDLYPRFIFNTITNKVEPLITNKIYPFVEGKWEFHHYVEKKFIRTHPAIKSELPKIQKTIYMPENMNKDIDKRTAGFKKRWKIELKEVVYLED